MFYYKSNLKFIYQYYFNKVMLNFKTKKLTNFHEIIQEANIMILFMTKLLKALYFYIFVNIQNLINK